MIVAVQVACVMSSYCEARLWQFSYVVVPWGGVCPVMDGRFICGRFYINASNSFKKPFLTEHVSVHLPDFFETKKD